MRKLQATHSHNSNLAREQYELQHATLYGKNTVPY